MDRVLEYRVQENDIDITAGGLVGKLLKHCMGLTSNEISRAKFTQNGISIIREGGLTDCHASVTVRDRANAGDILRVRFSDTEEENELKVVPSRGEVSVLYEDEDVVALDKPAGIVSHPSHGHYSDSLMNYLAGHYAGLGLSVHLRAVGRLDKDTSGIILFARNAPAASRLYRQKETGIFQKTYLAVTANPPEKQESEGWNVIDLPMGPVPGALMKQQIELPPAGKRALTRYICHGRFDGGTVMKAEIDTGRTHQIRVHMASVGHPLIGDRLYGNESEIIKSAERALLHAWKATFRQPFSGEEISITAPLPDDMKEYIL